MPRMQLFASPDRSQLETQCGPKSAWNRSITKLPGLSQPMRDRIFMQPSTRKCGCWCLRYYLALAGGTIPFIRRYSTIWP